jgi:hypothetical protein
MFLLNGRGIKITALLMVCTKVEQHAVLTGAETLSQSTAQYRQNCVRFEVLTAVKVAMLFLRIMMLHRLICRY